MKLRRLVTYLSQQLGCCDVITENHVKKMKDMSIICNIGHFDSEIQVDKLKKYEWSNIKPQVDLIKISKKKALYY